MRRVQRRDVDDRVSTSGRMREQIAVADIPNVLDCCGRGQAINADELVLSQSTADRATHASSTAGNHNPHAGQISLWGPSGEREEAAVGGRDLADSGQ
jgi:hypothetical protein